ncbi:MAG: AtpZ/AtpI family protein [Sulfurovum sp.]|nr:AtpZ/AtpI family protein [Sulfurovum sp.]MCB4752036.1 AtpZ/AtpI family protein [Sulfurovum sp.]MCB4783648.1 AtpZ/AtpI family protein [Sulfurovum sp.]
MIEQKEEPKFKKIVNAADGLSLGISIVVAVLIGIGIGVLLKSWTDEIWTLWIGVLIGIGAAVNNVYIAYKKQKASLDELAKDPRYRYGREIRSDEDDDEDY